MAGKSTHRAKGGLPTFTPYWYEGKDTSGKLFMPEVPEGVAVDNSKLPKAGNLVVGTKGTILVNGDYWNRPQLHPLKRLREFGDPKTLLELVLALAGLKGFTYGNERGFLRSCKPIAGGLLPSLTPLAAAHNHACHSVRPSKTNAGQECSLLGWK